MKASISHIPLGAAAIVAAAAGMMYGSCGRTASGSGATDVTPAQSLLARLDSVASARQVIFGHADDTAYGREWWAEEGRSDVKETAGDFPGLINWDLGLIERNSPVNLDSVDFNLMRREILAQHERGGINALSWHPLNPHSGANSWTIDSIDAVALAVTDGTAENDSMKVWLGRAAEFIGGLRDGEGRCVPVVFRPWHEHTGSWFWWGGDNTTTPSYVALWKLTREVFDQKGVDNVVWAYSPDVVADAESYMNRYPGDSLVDIMGADVYHFNGLEGVENYRRNAAATLSVARDEAARRGKLFAFTETGSEALPVSDWFTSELLPLIEQFRPVYVCVWRNANIRHKENHFYAPYPGHPSQDSFRVFRNDSITIFANEMAQIH